MSLKLIIAKITDPIYLTYELILSNRRLIFPTMVGLVIALTVIAQSNMLIESYREEIFDEIIFSQDGYNYGDITVDIDTFGLQDIPGIDVPDFMTNLNKLNNYINASIIQSDYSDYIRDYYWYSNPDMNVWVNITGRGYPSKVELDDSPISTYISSSMDFYDQLEDILEEKGSGRLPVNDSEFLLLRPHETIVPLVKEFRKFENFTLNSEINITLPLPRNWGSEDTLRVNKTVKIVGLLEYKSEQSVFYIDDVDSSGGLVSNLDNVTKLTKKYLGDLWGYHIITFPTFLKQTLMDLSEFATVIRWGGQINGKIFLDSSNFNAFNVNAEKSKLQKFIISLEDNLYTLSYDFDIQSNVFGWIQAFEMRIIGLVIIMLLVSFPVICIALYLVTYSFGLIRRQKQEQIGIIKTRGGSWFQVFTFLLGEMIISTVIAVFAGFILSIILSDVVMRSNNYLEFLGNPVPVRFSTRMIQDLIIWGILISFLLNFLRIIRMSRQDITETLTPVETRSPLWKRYYIDVIIFVIGTATWVILMTLVRMMATGEGMGGFYALYMLVSLLGIPAPFLMFFGTIMVIARIFPFLMRKLSEILWKIEGGITALAIRNIVRHKQAANRAVLLITLAISFSILASSLIFSLDETEHINYYYKHGADINLNGNGIYNDTITKLLKENVSDITHVSSVFSAEFQTRGMIWREYNFLFLDPNTYVQTAFFKSSFKLSNSLSNLMEEISDNQTIILYEGNFKNDVSKPKIGDNLTYFFSNSTTSEYLSFKIGGTFNLWPMVYPESWYNLDNHYWMIGSLGMFQSLNQWNYLNRIENNYLAKLDSQTNVEDTVEEIYNVTSITPNSPALAYIQYKESFDRRFTLSLLNTDLIICVTVSVIGVIMFAFFTYVERGKEIGVERALGMTRIQTAMSFLVEASTILAFGTIIGFLTGTYFVTMFLQITQFGVQIPPIVVAYPIPLLAQIIIVIVVVAGIGTITPAYMATRRDISRILKVE